MQTILNLLQPFWGLIVGAAGVLIAVVGAYFKGRSEQKLKDKVATQGETIDAYKDRQNVEDRYRNAPDAERERMRDKWRRD